jgi:hypothetical protein
LAETKACSVFQGATRQGLDSVTQGLQRQGARRYSAGIEARLLIVKRAVGQYEEEPVANCSQLVNHFDIDILGALAEVGEQEPCIRLMSLDTQLDSRALEEVVHRFIGPSSEGSVIHVVVQRILPSSVEH